MTDDKRRKAIADEIARLNKKYGLHSAALGSERRKLQVVPTGVLALDYALGTGGWPLGHPIHIYGEPDIGKSSTLGFSAFRNAQAMDLTCGLIAVEPGFDPDWAAKNGVDLDYLIVSRPNNGTEAFNVLYDWINDDIVDFIVFDSLGGVVTPSEDQEEGKARVGGASGLITSGVRRNLMPTWKREKGLIFLNQIRDDLKSMHGNVKPPGGHLVEHGTDIWIHLRQTAGSDSYRKVKETADVKGYDVTVGRRLTAVVTRNKMCEGTGKRATFWYNQMDTEDYGPVGIDGTEDIVATAVRTGVIKKSGGWYTHSAWDDKSLQGLPAVSEFFAAHPDAISEIREAVLEVMDRKTKFNKPGDLKLVEGAA